MRSPSAAALLALAVSFVGVIACEDKKPSSDTARSDGGTGADKYASADPKLEKAMKAAASASAGESSGPPPTGIFEAGAADKRHPKATPTKVDVVVDGADPKVSLASLADAGAEASRESSYGPAIIELAMEMGRGAVMPTVDFQLGLLPAKKEEGGPDWLVGSIVRATPAKQQSGQLPPGLDKAIGSLQGSEMRIKWTSDGRESDLVMNLSKSANADLERLAQSAAEALVFATIPLPPRPVGVGGQWIAETRMPLAGLDVLAYRAYKVKSIEGDRLHLTLDVKAYATSKELSIPGIPKGATFEQFDGQAQGELELVRGEVLARKSDVQQRIVMVFAGAGGPQPPQQQGQPPGNMMTGQIDSQATFLRGEDLRTAMTKKP